jgi:hypothetical protein
MSIYILQKDLPNLKAGTEFTDDQGKFYRPVAYPSDSVTATVFNKMYVENNPEWFQPKEDGYTKNVFKTWEESKPKDRWHFFSCVDLNGNSFDSSDVTFFLELVMRIGEIRVSYTEKRMELVISNKLYHLMVGGDTFNEAIQNLKLAFANKYLDKEYPKKYKNK